MTSAGAASSRRRTAGQVRRLQLHRMPDRWWRVGLTVPQQVDRDRPVVTAEHGQVRRPGGAAAGEPVQQQQRTPGTLDADRIADAIGHGQAGHRTAPIAASWTRRCSTTLRARSVRRRSTRTPGRARDVAKQYEPEV